jgi:hypothetical protein
VQSIALIEKSDPECPVNETVPVHVHDGANTKRTAKDIKYQPEKFFAHKNGFRPMRQRKGGISMYRPLSMTLAVIMITGFLAGPAASADDNSCWLQAEQSLYLVIYDLDNEGSILSQIWEGVLDQGNKKLIKSSNAKIRYYTNPDADASSPGIDLTCHNNEVISVP